MKIGAIVAVGLAVAGTAALTAAFVNNSSPYVTIKESQDRGATVHVAGQIVPKTLKRNIMAQEVRFDLKDESGSMPVVYTGPPQSNLETATQVVVIGTHKDGVFHAKQMLVKCPSKYESDDKKSA
ncbi:MAG: cytochrome c maturation protein CcmE [Armatimonadetes bacterium]|nr:cytochrome c maturation protein CcmE [Armatimonadota bacterium]